MRTLILLPHQLFSKELFPEDVKKVVFLEHPHFFTKRRFHKQKLIFHRASMKSYASFLKNEGFDVKYIDFSDCQEFLEKTDLDLYLFDPIEHPVQKEFKKFAKNQKNFELLDSPMFMTTPEVKEAFIKGSKKHFSMQNFYIMQRKAHQILIEHDKPTGGKWSYDTENRKSFPKKGSLPKVKSFAIDEFGKEAIKYVEKHFKDHFGISDVIFPIDHEKSKKWLLSFVKERLHDFGAFEDAIVPEETFLYHSGLSAILNIGLLTPVEVIEVVLNYASKHAIPLNSLEGFIRQVIGWREYMKLLYDIRAEELYKENHFHHKRKLPKSYWDASTGIVPIDQTIEKIKLTAYAHHIERLMILGNFMLLCEFDPKEIYEWFMEMFIDSYEWVMVTNVMSMSQYADGGIMTTKPYASSSNYVIKMSHYPKDSWCQIWDSLYWNFIFKHLKEFEKNPRMSMMTSLAKKMNEEKAKTMKKTAQAYLKTLD